MRTIERQVAHAGEARVEARKDSAPGSSDPEAGRGDSLGSARCGEGTALTRLAAAVLPPRGAEGKGRETAGRTMRRFTE